MLTIGIKPTQCSTQLYKVDCWHKVHTVFYLVSHFIMNPSTAVIFVTGKGGSLCVILDQDPVLYILHTLYIIILIMYNVYNI